MDKQVLLDNINFTLDPSEKRNKIDVLCDVISEEVFSTLDREGFTRRILQKTKIVANPEKIIFGIYPGIGMDEAFIEASKASNSNSSFIGSDLDTLFQDALEVFLAREDNETISLLKEKAKHKIKYKDSLTYELFCDLLSKVKEPSTILLSFDSWNSIIESKEFITKLVPNHDHPSILEGNLGVLHNCKILTDIYRYPTLSVLESDELFIIPNNLGTYYSNETISRGIITQESEIIINSSDIVYASKA